MEKSIEDLQGQLAYRANMHNLLERRLDDLEQYGRRTSLRISGIASGENETAEHCLEKVKEEIQKVAPELHDGHFDRAHRVGKVREDGKERLIIVKFTSFWARTWAYRRRVREEGKPRFYLDHTQRRFKLKKFAEDNVKTVPSVDFVFTDINSNLTIRFKNG